MLNRRELGAMLGGSALCAPSIAAACSGYDGFDPLRIGLTGASTSFDFDPVWTEPPYDVTTFNLFPSLCDVVNGPGGFVLEPWLAEEWRLRAPQSDGLLTEFVVLLRRGLEWGDGGEITADDVRASVRRQLDPDSCHITPLQDVVKEIIKIDDHSVLYRLHKPWDDADELARTILTAFSGAVMPEALAEARPLSRKQEDERSCPRYDIGVEGLTQPGAATASYTLVEHHITEFLDLRCIPWGGVNDKDFATVRFLFLPSYETGLIALLQGEIDILGPLWNPMQSSRFESALSAYSDIQVSLNRICGNYSVAVNPRPRMNGSDQRRLLRTVGAAIRKMDLDAPRFAGLAQRPAGLLPAAISGREPTGLSGDTEPSIDFDLDRPLSIAFRAKWEMQGELARALAERLEILGVRTDLRPAPSYHAEFEAVAADADIAIRAFVSQGGAARDILAGMSNALPDGVDDPVRSLLNEPSPGRIMEREQNIFLESGSLIMPIADIAVAYVHRADLDVAAAIRPNGRLGRIGRLAAG